MPKLPKAYVVFKSFIGFAVLHSKCDATARLQYFFLGFSSFCRFNQITTQQDKNLQSFRRSIEILFPLD